VRQRVARSRELVAEGHSPSVVARVARISRQALYRVPTPRKPPQRRPRVDPVEQAIVEEALANQTDGYRMVTAFVRRKLGVAVNRKRVLRLLRERKLIHAAARWNEGSGQASSGSSGRGSCGSPTWSATRRRETVRRCEGSAAGLSQQPGEAGGSLIRETPVRVGSSPDDDGTGRYCQTARVRQARRKGVREEPAS
jgi:hypothetical protein